MSLSPQDHPTRSLAHTSVTDHSTAASAPAYHAVQVRQSFSQPAIQYTAPQPHAVPHVPDTQPAKSKIEWPESVRAYVRRSFEPQYTDDGVTRKDMESKLKQTISSATENDTLHSIDWDNYPLPQQMIRYERSNAAHRWQHA